MFREAAPAELIHLENSWGVSPEVAATLSRQTGYPLKTVAARLGAGNFFFTVFERKLFGKFQVGFSLPFGLYGCPLNPVAPSYHLMNQLRESPSPLVFQNPFLEESLNKSSLLKLVSCSTHLIKLMGRSFSDIESAHFNSDLRYSIRRAKRSGLELRSGNDLKIIEEFYELFALSSLRWGQRTPKYPRSFFQGLEGAAWVTFHLAYLEKVPVSGVVIARLGGQDLYWFGAMDKKHTRLCAGHLLIAKALEEATLRGASWFNFGASGKLHSVRKFKESFGARSFPYGIYYAGNHLIGQMLRLLYRMS